MSGLLPSSWNLRLRRLNHHTVFLQYCNQMAEASDVPVLESWVSDGNSESFGTSFHIVLQLYLDVITRMGTKHLCFCGDVSRIA